MASQAQMALPVLTGLRAQQEQMAQMVLTDRLARQEQMVQTELQGLPARMLRLSLSAAILSLYQEATL